MKIDCFLKLSNDPEYPEEVFSSVSENCKRCRYFDYCQTRENQAEELLDTMINLKNTPLEILEREDSKEPIVTKSDIQDFKIDMATKNIWKELKQKEKRK